MSQLMRFGRRLALPSTRQIKHELAVLIAANEQLGSLKHGGAEAAVVAAGAASTKAST